MKVCNLSNSSFLCAAGDWSGNGPGNRALLGFDAVPVPHPSRDTVPGLAFLPREPTLPAHQQGGREQSRGWWVTSKILLI